MNLTTYPSSQLKGLVSLPGDKSISHRAALFAAMADGVSTINNFLIAGVTKAMLRNLRPLGVNWKLNGSTLVVDGIGYQNFKSPREILECGNSGTTMRLLAGALAASGVPAILDGSSGLRRRPMKRIVNPLRMMGVPIEASAEGTAPIKLASRPLSKPLTGIDYSLPVASAQVKSAILLAALAADSSTTLREPGLSRDHTERMFLGMGMSVVRDKHSSVSSKKYSVHGRLKSIGGEFIVTLTPKPSQSLQPLTMTIPGDISSGAFIIVASLITPGSEVSIENVGLNPTRTGLLDALKMMHADIKITKTGEHHGEPFGDITVRCSDLQGINISGKHVVRMIDEFPAFAVAAAFANGITVVRQAEELRYKETDRISVLCKELSKLGIDVQEKQDGFIINGGKKVRGGIVDPHGDHRLAMALSLIGLVSEESVTVRDAEIITESFPDFISIIQDLGAQIDLDMN